MARKLVGSLSDRHFFPHIDPRPPSMGQVGVKKIILSYQISLATSHMMIIWPDQTWPVTKKLSSRGPIKASLVLFYFGLAELLQHDNCFMKIQWQKNFGFASFKAQYYSQQEWKCSKYGDSATIIIIIISFLDRCLAQTAANLLRFLTSLIQTILGSPNYQRAFTALTGSNNC